MTPHLPVLLITLLAGPTTDDGATAAPATGASGALPTEATPPEHDDATAPTRAADEGMALRGPTVSAHTSAATIVVRTFEGRIVPVEGEPEAAALRVLSLDDAQREAVAAIVARRISFFDELVRTHLPELERGIAGLGRIEHAKNGSQRWAAISEFARAWEAFAPWRERGTVIDEASELIPESMRRRAQRMSLQYHAALTKERASDLGLKSSTPQVQVQVRLESFGAMVQAAFDRMQRSGDADFERLSRELRLTPEQTERARTLFSDLALRELRREATGWHRFQAFSEFMSELAPEQRARAWRYIRRENR